MRSRRQLPLHELAPRLLPDIVRGQRPALIDWADFFGNGNPVEIEVGSGKGLFLINAAASRADINFLGIEIVRGLQLRIATRLLQLGIPNVKVAGGDAHELLRDRVPSSSVQAVHVYFPDPWWKKRHRKRRVFTPDFVAGVARILNGGGLNGGGRFHIVTDVEEYFAFIADLMNETTAFQSVSPPEPTAANDESDYLTNFERKYRKEGRPIYRAAFVKC